MRLIYKGTPNDGQEGRDMSHLKRVAQKARVLLAVLACLALAALVPALRAHDVLAADTSDHPELRITVVESIPAEQIEDDSVPLAAGPGGGSAIETPQVVLMSLVLAGSVFYALYARRCDERLFALRREVIDAERQLDGRGDDSWA